ncbi:hypothetical protein D9757_005497 [Collybiopsis confluens]|uniref:Chorismate mutase n=1 Tax=Collybiopsis confluens TaxID=2823264 RepID=A0A8H5HMA1_9AGAR|nr:hypothetical protein D9757_005497 [Collybiopsis confluens]
MQSNLTVGDPLSLERIRSVLNRLEDTIIFDLIERAQFAHNPQMYQRGAFTELKDIGFEGSWLEWFLKETETFHAKARRYTRWTLALPYPSSLLILHGSPDEYPFTNDLPGPVLRPLQLPEILFPNKINVNPSILSFYVRSIVPRITRRATLALAASKRSRGIVGDDEYEDDGNYGSAATIDVEVLQAISKRVHYGKFVSESKFLENPSAFIPHIQKRNRQPLEDLITKPEVERKLLVRLRGKAATYAQEFSPDGAPNGVNGVSAKIEVDSIVDLYESYIIPLTKEVEVDYLLHRLDGLSEDDINRLTTKGGTT